MSVLKPPLTFQKREGGPKKGVADYRKLEERIIELERMSQLANEIHHAAEASFRTLLRLVKVSNKVTEREIDILLRAVVRLQGLEPKHWTKKHLIKALLEDDYGVKLSFRKKGNAGRPMSQR